MPFFHLVNCASLTFAPHAIYYYATPLSDYDAWPTSLKGSAVYCAAFFAKLICLATFVSTSEANLFDPAQELLQGLIGLLDVVGLYFALTKITARVSLSHKFQAIGLGWAFADSVLHRLAPLWMGARSMEFSWKYLQEGVHANANLVYSLSFAAVVSLLWMRKNKPEKLVPILYLSVFIHAFLPAIQSCTQQLLQLQPGEVLLLDLFSTTACAVASWRLYTACGA
ncbi:hypothetical protein CYMTET_12807 [Cymbomonas tetramitiformis]|uniref:BOS complex subunit TMEM147 n=1 Tax=Cymbomonas tetramitiformis TaxID=36881 RepID=A0AAE0GJQ6_9CHLO|nr:hypothetical protein CYMTET_12807 [Cymbomonas tetramitiformis]